MFDQSCGHGRFDGIVTELLYTKLFLLIVNVLFGGLTPVISTSRVIGEHPETSQARLIINVHNCPLSIFTCKDSKRYPVVVVNLL